MSTGVPLLRIKLYKNFGKYDVNQKFGFILLDFSRNCIYKCLLIGICLCHNLNLPKSITTNAYGL